MDIHPAVATAPPTLPPPAGEVVAAGGVFAALLAGLVEETRPDADADAAEEVPPDAAKGGLAGALMLAMPAATVQPAPPFFPPAEAMADAEPAGMERTEILPPQQPAGPLVASAVAAAIPREGAVPGAQVAPVAAAVGSSAGAVLPAHGKSPTEQASSAPPATGRAPAPALPDQPAGAAMPGDAPESPQFTWPAATPHASQAATPPASDTTVSSVPQVAIAPAPQPSSTSGANPPSPVVATTPASLDRSQDAGRPPAMATAGGDGTDAPPADVSATATPSPATAASLVARTAEAGTQPAPAGPQTIPAEAAPAAALTPPAAAKPDTTPRRGSSPPPDGATPPFQGEAKRPSPLGPQQMLPQAAEADTPASSSPVTAAATPPAAEAPAPGQPAAPDARALPPEMAVAPAPAASPPPAIIPTPEPPARPAPPVAYPARQVAPFAVALALGPESSINLTLNPGELGRVEVAIERGNGEAHISLRAERPETLALLQRDRAELERALSGAGIGTSDGRAPSLSFGLGGEGGTAQGQARRQPSPRNTPPAQPRSEAAAPLAPRSLIDLAI